MKRLWVAMCLVMSVGCADEGDGPASTEGCGDGLSDELKETCDDGNRESGDGCSSDCLIEQTITAHWTFENTAGEVQTCPAGFDTVEVLKETLRVTLAAASFPCVDGEGTFETHEIARSQTGGYRLQLRRGDAGELFGETRSSDYPSGPTGDHPFDLRFKMTTDLGRLAINWKLSQAGVQRSCEAIGVTSVRIDLIPATGPTITLMGTCSSLPYTTGRLKTGVYRVELTAASASGMGFGALDGVGVPTGGLLTELPPIDIAF